MRQVAMVAEASDMLQGVMKKAASLASSVDVTANEIRSLDETSRQQIISRLRVALLSAQDVCDRLESAMPPLLAQRTWTSRSGHLCTLPEQIGVRPTRSWMDEWQDLTDETLALFPWKVPKAEVESSLTSMQEALQSDIAELEEDGWPRERAVCYVLLHSRKAAIARALRDGDRMYAAATYALCEAIFCQRIAQQASNKDQPEMLYTHLDGLRGLATNEPAWRTIEQPDRTGFCGLTSSSLVSADADPARFAAEGHCAEDSSGTLVAQDSDVVGFKLMDDNDDGAHSPVSQGARYGCFPPNTLYRLDHIKPPGTWEAPGGVWPQQRLLVVTATYRPVEQLANGAEWQGGKMCCPLSYGTRAAFVEGVAHIIQFQTLTLEDEWQRVHAWSDWKGITYTMREEWAYVTGVARRTPGRTAGTRDMDHAGKTVEDFVEDINSHVRKRRGEPIETHCLLKHTARLSEVCSRGSPARAAAAGFGAQLHEEDALLTREEVLAVRLYSGPGYQPVNEFLRQVARLSGDYRRELVQHPGLTLGATVLHLVSAIRKLSAVATDEEARAPLWRGVRGTLPVDFWQPDATGIVCAVDMAFMSTSRNKQTPIEYMGEGENVLWALRPSRESDTGFHCGADISMLSQFAHEQEVLYPPATMLEVVPGVVWFGDEAGAPAAADAAAAPPAAPPAAAPATSVAASPPIKEASRLAKTRGGHYLEVGVRPTFV